MELILHFIGLCPDSLNHLDLIDLINFYFNYKNIK